MIKVRNLAKLLALSGAAALPACSWLGIGDHGRESRAAAPTQTYAAATPAAPAAAPAAPELTPDMTRSVQQTLQQDGLYHGRVDGVWGRGTEAAVRNFQQQHNLNATGKLDQDTLTAMNLGTGSNPPANPPPTNPPAGAAPPNPPPRTNP
jgi:peptidoglycan hydrolase-like protein with peptidoglycan-binding domain